MNTSLRIVVADNHTCFRVGLTQVLRHLPGVAVVGETMNGDELLHMARSLEPDLVFVEAELDGINGTEACRLLLQYNPGILILALSWYENEGHIHAMLSAGARGFLAKTVDPQQVVEAIRTVRETNRYYLGTRKMQLAEYFTKCKYPELPPNPVALKPKDLEIIRLIAMERTTAEIAAQLYLSPRTVSDYRQAILEKTGSKNPAGMVMFAVRNNLL